MLQGHRNYKQTGRPFSDFPTEHIIVSSSQTNTVAQDVFLTLRNGRIRNMALSDRSHFLTSQVRDLGLAECRGISGNVNSSKLLISCSTVFIDISAQCGLLILPFLCHFEKV